MTLIPLKSFRSDLTAQLATALGTAATPLGAQVNPPALIVRPSSTYLTGPDYCTDDITFEAVLVADPGEPDAVIDALDDMIDLVRSTLRNPSPAGRKYGFRSVSGHVAYTVGERDFPAVVITVAIQRVS